MQTESIHPLVVAAGAPEEIEELARALPATAELIVCESPDALDDRAEDACAVVAFHGADDGIGEKLTAAAPRALPIVVEGGGDQLRNMAIAAAAAQARAAAAGLAANEFTRLTTHELRGHFSTIGLACDVLKMNAGDGPGAKPIGIIEGASARAVQFIDTLSELATLERGAAELVRSEIDARSPVQEALAEHQKTADRRKLEVAVEVPEGISVEVDRGRTVLALANLIGLAVRHAVSRVTIGAAAADGGVVYWVEIAGLELDEVRRSELLGRTWRGPSGRGSLEMGAILADLVARGHGGRVVAKPHAGGTRLELALPAMG